MLVHIIMMIIAEVERTVLVPPGRRIVELEMMLLLIHLSQNYILKTKDVPLPLTEVTTIKNSIPVDIHMVKRN